MDNELTQNIKITLPLKQSRLPKRPPFQSLKSVFFTAFYLCKVEGPVFSPIPWVFLKGRLNCFTRNHYSSIWYEHNTQIKMIDLIPLQLKIHFTHNELFLKIRLSNLIHYCSGTCLRPRINAIIRQLLLPEIYFDISHVQRCKIGKKSI